MEFNAEQLRAIESTARNLLVLAGAGTGKTRTIIGRTRHLINQGVDPKRIVVVTFTRRAAREIRQRLAGGAMEIAKSQLVTGTFHNLCLRIMSARRQWFGYENMTVMDRDDQVQLMRLVRAELVPKRSTMPQAATLINYYSYARNTNQDPKRYLEKFTDLDESATEKTLEIFEAYKSRKRANSYLDYDDILHRFARVLRGDEQVRQRVCSQYEHVLVDEMQDTNPLQWLILQSFAEYASLFCVGDDAQSIYAFRGADFKNVHSFSERLQGGQTLKLEMNYRSTQPILDLANWLLRGSPLKYGKQLRSTRGSGVKPQLLDFETDSDEAGWIVDYIKQRRSQGAAWREHMILCRTAYNARPIEAELIEQKVPYRFVGGMSLLQMAHVKDLLAVLRGILNHQDEIAWVRYLMLWQGIGEVTAARLLERMRTQPNMNDALEVLRQATPRQPEIAAIPRSALRHLDKPEAAIELVRTQLEPVLEPKYDRWDVRSKDLLLLENLAARHRTVAGFLETYTLDPISTSEIDAQTQTDEGVVTLITVHSAKGTEAEVCFVPSAQPGNYPHFRSLEDSDAVEEERRVLYVALTRAQDELILSRNLSRGHIRTSWNASAGGHYFLDRMPLKLVDASSKLNHSSWHRDDFFDEDVIL